MNESKAIARIHDKKRKADSIDRASVHPWKITDDFQSGVPDCNYTNTIASICSPLWIEYKYMKDLPKRESTQVKVKWHSNNQREWMNRLYDSGQTALVIIAFGDGAEAGAVILYDREWDNGITTTEARRRAVKLNTCATIINRVACDDEEVTEFIKNFEGNLNYRTPD